MQAFPVNKRSDGVKRKIGFSALGVLVAAVGVLSENKGTKGEDKMNDAEKTKDTELSLGLAQLIGIIGSGIILLFNVILCLGIHFRVEFIYNLAGIKIVSWYLEVAFCVIDFIVQLIFMFKLDGQAKTFNSFLYTLIFILINAMNLLTLSDIFSAMF